MTRKTFVWRNVWAGGIGGGVPWFIVLLLILNTMYQNGELNIGSFFRLLTEFGVWILLCASVMLGFLWGGLSGLMLGAMLRSNFGGYSSRNCWWSMGITVGLSALANCLVFLGIVNLFFDFVGDIRK